MRMQPAQIVIPGGAQADELLKIEHDFCGSLSISLQILRNPKTKEKYILNFELDPYGDLSLEDQPGERISALKIIRRMQARQVILFLKSLEQIIALTFFDIDSNVSALILELYQDWYKTNENLIIDKLKTK
jgi:hypothetical protein